MSARLGERLRGMLRGVGALFRVPYSGTTAESRPVLRGNMRRAIVVKTPDDMFAEAVFILRDDYDTGVSRGELLRQAKSAAEGHAQRALPPRRYTYLPPMAVFVLGASAAVLTLWISGVL